LLIGTLKDAVNGDGETSLDFTDQLKSQLQQERQHYEREISSLQAIHSQQLKALADRHQQEIQQIQSPSVSGDSNETLLSHMQAKNDHLLEKLKSNQEIICNLRQSISDFKQLVYNNQDSHLSHFEAEKRSLVSYVTEIQSSFKSHQTTVDMLQLKRTEFEEEVNLLTNEVDQLNSSLKKAGIFTWQSIASAV
jgi:chromosome segregation ATPase